MTDYTSTYAGPSDPPTGTATGTAKDEADRLKESATKTGSQLLEDAKSEAMAVSQEARHQLGDLWGQARSQVADEAGNQQSRLAGGLTSIGDQLTQMASSQSEQNVATDLVQEVGQRVGGLGRWFENHGPDELFDEVRSFARRRPVTFLALAAGAGVVVGRLTRGLKDGTDEVSGTARPTQAPVRTPVATYMDRADDAYVDRPEERPRFADDLSSSVASNGGWDER
jgi:hypothetical protein